MPIESIDEVFGSDRRPGLFEAVRGARELGKTVVQCHGVFDVLHPGHLDHLREAKGHGDFLVVSVTADRFVNKGPGRPVFSSLHRRRMIEALEIVDLVIESPSASAVEAIKLVRPDVFVKGPDYKGVADITGKLDLEAEAVEQIGGRIEFTIAPTMSSSALINRLGLVHSKEAKDWILQSKEELSGDTVPRWLNRIQQLNVLVIGELILDDYVFCEALGKTSKEPVLAFLKNYSERQLGGSAAIAKHCVGLGAQTTLLTRIGSDPAGKDATKRLRDSDVNVVAQTSESQCTITKTRYIDESSRTKVFETYDMIDAAASESDDTELLGLLEQEIARADVVLVADYGHGLMSERVIGALSLASAVVAVNTQSNAGNRGLNSISRYPRVDILSLNGGELALELRRRDLDVIDILPELGETSGASSIAITEGARGMALWQRGHPVSKMPAFTESVRDRVGAGDALFCAVALLLAVGAPPSVVGLCGNLAGAAMVSDLGNRNSVSSIDLQRHAEALLR